MTKICFIGDIHGKMFSPQDRLTDYNNDLFNQMIWVRDYCNDNNINVIVHLGDIFDKPEASDSWKNRFIEIWKDFNGKFYSIIGAAHDLFYNNEKSFNKTCLRNLELSGVLEVLDDKQIVIDNVHLISLSINVTKAKKDIKSIELSNNQYNIFVAHQFYEWGLDRKSGFTSYDLSKVNVPCSLILGHDHHQYDNVVCGNVTIYRPGSFMRTELSEETIKMTPRILIFDDGKFNYINVGCSRKIDEIYNVSEYRLRKSNTRVFSQIENTIKDLENYLHNDDTIIPCSKALKELKCPEPEYNYLKSIYSICNQPF